MTDRKQASPAPSSETRLESWKEIAAYLNRDVRTVIRWERSEGLPIHRHQHQSRSSVYAHPSELDAWQAARSPRHGRDAALSLRQRRVARVALAAGLLLSLLAGGDGWAPPMRAEPQRQGPSLTEVFGGPQPHDAEGRFSPDGKLFAATDWYTGNLVLVDVDKETATPLTDTSWDRSPMEFAEAPVWSPDGRRLAYCWMKELRCELRVVSRQGGKPEILFSGKGHFFPADWSPDGKHILGFVLRDDRKYTLATISTSGERTDLRELDSVTIRAARFSPDGRFVAYDSALGSRQALFMFSLGTKTEARLTDDASEEYLAAWSPDGRFLLLVSNRSGRWDLWALPVRDGRPAGDQRLLYPDIGQVALFNGWHDKHHLVFNKTTSVGQFYAARVDASTGAILGSPSTPVREYQGQHVQALWAPDGQRLALLLQADPLTARPRGQALIISGDSGVRKIDTGPLTWKRLVSWLPSGEALVLSALHASGAVGFYVVGLAGGAPVPLHEDSKMNWSTGQLSADGAAVAYFRSDQDGTGWALHVYDLKQKRTVRLMELQPGEEYEYRGPRWAPEGDAVYYLSRLPGRGTSRIVRVPLPEGDAKEILGDRDDLPSFAVSPDGRLLAYSRRRALASQRGAISPEFTYDLLLVESTGGSPKKVQLPTGHNPYFVVWSPDGRQIGYISWKTKHQFFRLGNFLPRGD